MGESRERQIEMLRLKMYRCFKEDRYGEEVVHVSQELDKLMNEFIVLPKKKRNNSLVRN